MGDLEIKVIMHSYFSLNLDGHNEHYIIVMLMKCVEGY